MSALAPTSATIGAGEASAPCKSRVSAATDAASRSTGNRTVDAGVSSTRTPGSSRACRGRRACPGRRSASRTATESDRPAACSRGAQVAAKTARSQASYCVTVRPCAVRQLLVDARLGHRHARLCANRRAVELRARSRTVAVDADAIAGAQRRRGIDQPGERDERGRSVDAAGAAVVGQRRPWTSCPSDTRPRPSTSPARVARAENARAGRDRRTARDRRWRRRTDRSRRPARPARHTRRR